MKKPSGFVTKFQGARSVSIFQCNVKRSLTLVRNSVIGARGFESSHTVQVAFGSCRECWRGASFYRKIHVGACRPEEWDAVCLAKLCSYKNGSSPVMIGLINVCTRLQQQGYAICVPILRCAATCSGAAPTSLPSSMSAPA
jgi:hypothetical protein